MADSVLPAFSQWWRSNGSPDGDGALIKAGSSSTLFDRYALPAGGRKWTVEYEYSAAAESVVWIVVNKYTATNVKIRDVAIHDRRLPAAQNARVVIDFDLPAAIDAKWLPSIVVRESTDVKFNYVKVYETPVPSGPPATVWNGANEVAASVTVWDGTREIPATLEIQA